MGAEKGGASFLAGAMVDGWEAPALNQLFNADKSWRAETGYSSICVARSFCRARRRGRPDGTPVVGELATLPETDVRAMANYLISLSNPTGLNWNAGRRLPLTFRPP